VSDPTAASRFAGAHVPDPGFADDDGATDPALAAALAALGQAAADPALVLNRLLGARVMVPVVAVLESAEVGADGLRREKESAMATVTVAGPDGRRALLAFTSLASLQRWRADARPVLVRGAQAAQAALAERADTLLLDVEGPVPFAVAGADLRMLAYGAAAQFDLAAVARSVLAGLPQVVAVGERRRPSVLSVQVIDGLTDADLAALTRQILALLGAEPVLRARLSEPVTVLLEPADPTPA
jgi:hypothetical protein